jgi:predicted secreted protein
MSWFTGVVVYFLIWWTALFCVLPIGVRPQTEARTEEGGWRGAPVKHHLGLKVLGTTALSAVLWLGVYGLVESGWISFREGWFAMPTNEAGPNR